MSAFPGPHTRPSMNECSRYTDGTQQNSTQTAAAIVLPSSILFAWAYHSRRDFPPPGTGKGPGLISLGLVGRQPGPLGRIASPLHDPPSLLCKRKLIVLACPAPPCVDGGDNVSEKLWGRRPTHIRNVLTAPLCEQRTECV